MCCISLDFPLSSSDTALNLTSSKVDFDFLGIIKQAVTEMLVTKMKVVLLP